MNENGFIRLSYPAVGALLFILGLIVLFDALTGRAAAGGLTLALVFLVVGGGLFLLTIKRG